MSREHLMHTLLNDICTTTVVFEQGGTFAFLQGDIETETFTWLSLLRHALARQQTSVYHI